VVPLLAPTDEDLCPGHPPPRHGQPEDSLSDAERKLEQC